MLQQVETRYFVQNAPTSSGVLVSVVVERMTESDLERWHRTIQPDIDRVTASHNSRADRGWNWPNLYRRLSFVTFSEPEGWVLRSSPETGGVLCGLIYFVSRYPALDNHRENSVYVWYMTSAPSETIARLMAVDRSVVPRAIGLLLLDISLIRSFELGLDGRIGLHADPNGGTYLFERYKSADYGLHCLSPSALLPRLRGVYEVLKSGPKRMNDGRYFFHDPVSAMTQIRRSDRYRGDPFDADK